MAAWLLLLGTDGCRAGNDEADDLQASAGASAMIMDADVIIAGAGPSGLMVANEVAQAGARTLILERRGEPALSRAGVLAPRVLEIFDSRGFADAVLSRARELHTVPEIRSGIWAGFEGIDYTELDTPFPYVLLLSQIEVERIL